MQLEQAFELPFASADVWTAFDDTAMLVACMPGASLSGEPRAVDGGADLDLVFAVRLGPIAASFNGQGAIRRDAATRTGTFSGQGADRKSGSRVRGEAGFAIVALGDGITQVKVTVDYSLTGALAQFSRGAIVKDLAAQLTRAFADNLKARIAERQVAATESAIVPETAEVQAAVAAPAPAAAPLDAGRLFWRMLWARVCGWFGRPAR